MQDSRTFNRIQDFIRYIKKADIVATSAQAAYFILLSLFPLLVFLITLIGYLPIDEEGFYDVLVYYTPQEVTDYIHTTVIDLIGTRNGSLLSISIIGTLWSASNGINAIRRSLNHSYDVEESRSYLYTKTISIGLTIGFIFIIIIALILPVFGKLIFQYVASIMELPTGFVWIWNLLRWGLSTFVFFMILTILFKLIPNTRVSFKKVMYGALFSTLCLQIVSYICSYYVGTIGNYSTTYGSLGTIIALMVWLYLAAMVILIGGVINAFMKELKTNDLPQ